MMQPRRSARRAMDDVVGSPCSGDNLKHLDRRHPYLLPSSWSFSASDAGGCRFPRTDNGDSAAVPGKKKKKKKEVADHLDGTTRGRGKATYSLLWNDVTSSGSPPSGLHSRFSIKRWAGEESEKVTSYEAGRRRWNGPGRLEFQAEDSDSPLLRRRANDAESSSKTWSHRSSDDEGRQSVFSSEEYLSCGSSLSDDGDRESVAMEEGEEEEWRGCRYSEAARLSSGGSGDHNHCSINEDLQRAVPRNSRPIVRSLSSEDARNIVEARVAQWQEARTAKLRNKCLFPGEQMRRTTTITQKSGEQKTPMEKNRAGRGLPRTLICFRSTHT